MKDLTKGNIYKTFILFAIPLVLTGILTMAYSIINTVIAGKFLGEEGLAAVGATSAFITLISSVGWGFSSGYSMYVAKLFGSKDYKGIKSSIYCNFSIFLIISILISCTTLIFRNEIYDFLRIDKSILESAGIYFFIHMAGWSLILFNTLGAFTLNAFGISNFPFTMSLLSTVLNIAGSIVFIVMFDWGVSGIATSTVLSAAVVDIFYIIKIKQCFKEMKVDIYKVEMDFESIKQSFRYSLPVTVQQTVMYISSMIISVFINGLGSAATAGYSVVSKIYSLNANIYQNSAKTVSNYTAQSLGANKPQNLQKGVKVGFVQGVLFVLPVLLICIFFSHEVCSAFFPEGYTGISLTYSVNFSKYFLPFIIFNVINNLFHAFYRGVASMKVLIISTALGSVSNLVFSVILVKYYDLYGIFAGWILSWIVEAIFTIIVYLSKKWKTSEIKELEKTTK